MELDLKENINIEKTNIKDMYNICLKIFKTLPLSYYIKDNKVNCCFDYDSDSSYYDLFKNEIIISFKMIYNIIKNIENIEIQELEKYIRCLIYHETSHILLTPKDLFIFV